MEPYIQSNCLVVFFFHGIASVRTSLLGFSDESIKGKFFNDAVIAA